MSNRKDWKELSYVFDPNFNYVTKCIAYLFKDYFFFNKEEFLNRNGAYFYLFREIIPERIREYRTPILHSLEFFLFYGWDGNMDYELSLRNTFFCYLYPEKYKFGGKVLISNSAQGIVWREERQHGGQEEYKNLFDSVGWTEDDLKRRFDQIFLEII